MVFEIEFKSNAKNVGREFDDQVNAVMRSFAQRLTRGVADHTRQTLKGSGPLAVREDTGLLKRGLQVRGRANPRFSGTGTIGEIDVELTGEHGSGRAGAFTLPLVREDVGEYAAAPVTRAAISGIAREAWDAAIRAHNDDRSSR